MSYKKADLFFLIAFIVLGIAYWVAVEELPEATDSVSLGPRYFPTILAVLLLALCGASLLRAVRKSDRQIPLPNRKMMSVTIGLTMLFFAGWAELGYFYLFLFLFVLACLTTYKPLAEWKRHLSVHSAISLAITVMMYVIFQLAMGVRF